MTDPAINHWGLYVHIPFCQSRCTYCDFNTVTGMGEQDHAVYMKALMREWERIEDVPSGPLVSIFFGGGTPSLVSPDHIGELLHVVLTSPLTVSSDLEVTMEANPGTVDKKRLEAYRNAGVNRLSLGVQALQDHHLKRLNRIHSAKDARDAVSAARAAGFSNISLDLIYGLSQQTMAEWHETLDAACQLEPDHISMYQLQIEEGTPLATQLKKGQVTLPLSDTTADMADYGRDFMERAGLERYEISNYARNGRWSRHNRLYWTMNPYLALGAGAHGYWHGRRWWNVRGVRRYIEASLAGESVEAGAEPLARPEEMREYVWLGLRECQGFSRSRFVRRFGVVPEALFGRTLGRLLQQGLIERDGDRIRLSARGFDVANYVFREFVEETASA
ncbi:coproporphyrinogen III oxidase [Sulfobacillus thermotolerans]|uniref:Heme chaperone HemW n=1 Tax=Sulfobacillus thermotolerans TaxID=338644 RepID=A0ABM6RPF8_9FIRM|nr:coproporphyrinogen III oxidase [Sulfobacillus thermotolerans]